MTTQPFSQALKERQLRRYFQEWWHHSDIADEIIPLYLAIVVGLVTGAATVLFIMMIEKMVHFTGEVRAAWGNFGGIMLMVGVGFFVGLILTFIVPEIRGGGVSHVMEVVAVRRGRLRRRVAPLKMIASALTIGVGGSVGREGPIVQIGGSIGSTIGKLARLDDEDMAILVASGAAGGISAAFNAPITGMMFALEIILGRFSKRNLKAVIICSISANIISRPLLGTAPAFVVPAYPLDSVLELPVYIVLGVLCALASVIFIRCLHFSEHYFEQLDMPFAFKAAIGMGLTGLVGIVSPQALGSGLEFIGDSIADNIELGLGILLVLFFMKMLGTLLTLGAGNAGGDLAPTLFIGATLGSIVGRFFHGINPEIFVNPGAFALVGMAAMFAGAARAPITSIIIVLEMSNDYRLIIPLMLSVVVSTLLADLLISDSIYTLKLTMKGIRLERGQDIDILQTVSVQEVMTKNYPSVPPSITLIDLVVKFTQSHHHGFPVLDDKKQLRGMVSLSDVERAQEAGISFDATVLEFATTQNLTTCYPDDPIYVALRRMNAYRVGRLPVVRRGEEAIFLGMIRREDILRAYDIGMMRKSIEVTRDQQLRLRNVEKNAFLEFQVEPLAPMVGHSLAEFPFSKECHLLSIKRNGSSILPNGNTRIEAGDLIVAYADHTQHETITKQFKKDMRPIPKPIERNDGGL